MSKFFLLIFLTIFCSFSLISAVRKCKIINRHYAEHLCSHCSASSVNNKAGRDIFTLPLNQDEEKCYWNIINYENVSVIRHAKYGGNIYTGDNFKQTFMTRHVFARIINSNCESFCYWNFVPVPGNEEFSTIKNFVFDEYLFASDTVGKYNRRTVLTRIQENYDPVNDTKTHWNISCL